MKATQLEQLQQALAQKVIVGSVFNDYTPQETHTIFSFDIQYTADKAYVAIDVQTIGGNQLGLYVGVTAIPATYIPGLFCFREGPPLLTVLNHVREHSGLAADLLIVDGHGLAHPRLFGAACWLGVMTDIPTIGCAKRPLLKYDGDLATHRGATVPMLVNQQVVGYGLRTQDNIKPLYVSVGHRISLDRAAEIILSLAPTYRVIEPIRRADQAARAYAKGQTYPNTEFLGEIELED